MVNEDIVNQPQDKNPHNSPKQSDVFTVRHGSSRMGIGMDNRKAVTLV
ncbi:MAG: hypothetical protein QNJ53_29380 [Pleurocapsa sp. MO_192.B19]|nr:hypothetical protein [Pleurocapsa sp. MO_192.B19]